MSVTTIEWTKRPGTIGETWNPTTGCNKVDRGCKYCYSEIMHRRLQAMGQEKYKDDFLDGATVQPDTLMIPTRWKKPRTVFVNSMSDLFHELVPFEFIDAVFQTILDTPQHTYLVLTKRPEQALAYWKRQRSLGRPWQPPGNLWMGTSANDQDSARKRVPLLLELDGVIRFLSYEPATGPLKLRHLDVDEFHPSWCQIDALTGRHTDMARPCDDVPRLHWVIAGGESGPKAVPSHPGWFRQVRDDCKAAGVPFFFKQFGAWKPGTHEDPEGGQWMDHVTFPGLHENVRMIRSKTKSFNELDGEIFQQFPDTKKIKP